MTRDGSESGQVPSGYGDLLRLPAVPRVLAAAALARLGDGMFAVALVLVVLERERSPTLAGLAALCAFGPGLALGPLAGAVLDRFGPTRPMLADYAVSGVAVGLLGVLAAADRLGPPAVLALAAAYSTTSSLGSAGVRTLLPAIVPERLWDRANATDTGIFAATDAAGPALAGLLLAVGGADAALLANAALFAGAAVLLAGVRESRAPRRGVSLAASVAAGVRYLVGHRTLRGLALSYSLYQAAAGVLVVALPVLVLGRLGGTPLAVGLLWAVVGAAGVAGGLVAGRAGTVGRERRLIAGGMLVTAGAVLALPAAGTLLAVAACVCVLGLVAGPVDVAVLSLRQRRTDRAQLGRVVAISMSLNLAGLPLGSAAAGPLVEASLTLAVAVAAVCALAGAGAALRLSDLTEANLDGCSPSVTARSGRHEKGTAPP